MKTGTAELQTEVHHGYNSESSSMSIGAKNNSIQYDGKTAGGSRSGFPAAFFLAVLLCAGIFAGFTAYGCLRQEQWTVTQYASVSGGQCMCYTISGRNGFFAIVDGGYDVDAEQVRELIRKHHDHVDAWIITHTHPDHAGAFNKIMSDPANGITIERIYTVRANTERYRETAQSYDGFETHEDFVELTGDLEQLAYLEENDTLDLGGLKMKVLSAWDQNVDALPDHLCNDGSMMFRLDAPQRSMLFCADVQKEMEPFILAAHADELKATYVQCGHHGNWGLSLDFYERVAPEEAFLDGPDFLFLEGDVYDGYLLKQYFDEKGVTCHMLSSAPAKVILK